MKHKNELQIQIDDVYACTGRCPGCMLSALERKHREPDMISELMDLSITSLRDYVNAIDQLDRINITFGVADHMLMDDDYIISLHDRASDIIKLANPNDKDYSSIFFTTSLIGKPQVMINRLKYIKDSIKNPEIQFIPVVVFDPDLMRRQKFGERYRELILSVKEIFNKVDLSINISHETVTEFSPKEIHDFAADHGFDELTINWIPTLDNLQYTAVDLPALSDWLIDFDERLQERNVISSSYRPVIMRTIDAAMCFRDDDWSIHKSVKSLLPNTFPRSIQIDHLGNLVPKMEAIGDVAHLERFGYSILGNIKDKSIKNIVDEGLDVIGSRIMSAHLLNKKCQECEVAPICAGTGFHVINNVLRKKNKDLTDGDCPHIAKKLIKHFEKQVVEYV
jgi:radical SAM protein with 4Fe4S-binding SPASM domain